MLKHRRQIPHPPTPPNPTTSIAFDYHRTIIGYHGTDIATASMLADGKPFTASQNDDDWLGHGIYFWEYAPQQAWWWAQRRYKSKAAVVGAMIRLGRCLDLLDPGNGVILDEAHRQFMRRMKKVGQKPPKNFNTHKFLDCAVFNYLYSELAPAGYFFDSCRAVFVPMEGGRMPRTWERSGVFRGGHIQVCVRQPSTILALWPIKKDGRYGRE